MGKRTLVRFSIISDVDNSRGRKKRGQIKSGDWGGENTSIKPMSRNCYETISMCDWVRLRGSE